MKTLIHNIAQLVAVPPGPAAGERLGSPPRIEDAAVLVDGDRIAWFGPADAAPQRKADVLLDAEGGTVVPGLVDCHTHAVYAGSREREFVQRMGGASYIEILEAGGGIKCSVRALREATVAELVAQSRPRLERMLATGTTTIEIKSGYGLTPDDEIKMLRAVRALDEALPMDLVPTYLGAHTVPPEFEGRPDAYLDTICEASSLRRLRDERLAEFADVFCDRGAFNLEQSRRFLTTCKQHGLTPKIHAEQITRTGAARLAVELGAASADHLECVDDETIDMMRQSATIPVLLPGCSFFLGTDPAPARKLIDAGLPVALATDCNPGSCTVESLPLIMSMAATMLGMTPQESLVACTANAAAALSRADRIGAIAQGYQADLLILDVPNVDCWAYGVGVNAVRTVIQRGRVVHQRSRTLTQET